MTTTIVRSGHTTLAEAQRWHAAIEEVNEILDGQEYDKWKIADLLVELIPDGDAKVNEKLQKFADGIGGRLKKSTLTSYRRAAMRFPEDKRSDDKPFWYYAQASWHEKAEEIVATSTSEYELRQKLGGRDPYRVRNSRVQDALRDLDTARELLQPDLIHLWLQDKEIRERFIDELRITHNFRDVQPARDLFTRSSPTTKLVALPEIPVEDEEVGISVFA